MDSCIDKIAAFVENNLKREFTLQDVADEAGYSAYHFSREFKKMTGRSVMDYVRERKILAAAKDIKEGCPVLEAALAYGFDTHAGLTRAFSEVMGCTPQEYYQHHLKLKTRGAVIMDTTKIKIRLVCKDDVNDLWENVYSSMTPRQITEDKILPSIENYKNQNGFLAVAEVDGKAVMTMWVQRLYSSPGFIYDSHYCWQNSDDDRIFEKLLEGTIRFAKQLYITALCIYEAESSPYLEGFINGGFKKVFNAGGMDYYMLAI